MLKLTFCLHRQAHLTRAQFQDYWRNTHGPLVASFQKTLKIVRYVQSHALTDRMNDAIRAGRGAPEMYDGVAQLWWADMADFKAAYATPEGRAAGAALLEDEQRFIDLARSPLWFSEEKEIF